MPREHETGVNTAKLCRKHSISDATFYIWKAKYLRWHEFVGGGAIADIGGE